MQSQSGIDRSNPLRGGQQVFAYDDMGDIISLQNQNDNTTTLTYDGLGRLSGWTDPLGATTGFTYDKRGNLTRITLPIARSVNYTYDALSHVTEVIHSGDRIQMTYDANGNMLTVIDGDSSVSFVYDGDNILLEYDTNDILVARYTHGSKLDQPLSMERGGQNYYYHCDHRASVRVISDSAGMAVNRYDYDAYGRLESVTEGVSNPFAFTGREYDAESGFYYFRARYYDPQVGRFVTEDPILFAAGDSHLYPVCWKQPAQRHGSAWIVEDDRSGCGLGWGWSDYWGHRPGLLGAIGRRHRCRSCRCGSCRICRATHSDLRMERR